MSILLNILLSLVVGIASGLAVQPIQRWWERRANASYSKRLKAAKSEYKHVIYHARRPELLSSYMIARLSIVSLHVLMFLGLIMAMNLKDSIRFDLFHDYSSPSSRIVILVVIMTLWIFISVTVVRLISNGYSLYLNVRNFGEYILKVPTEIRDREAEGEILTGNHRSIEGDASISDIKTEDAG